MNILPVNYLKGTYVKAGFTLKDSSLEKEFSFQMGAEKSLSSENLKLLLKSLDIPNGSFALSSQIHGKEIAEVVEPGYYLEYDGLFTQTKNLMIGIRVADCAALIYSHEPTGSIGVAHAGWRGAVAGIHKDMITKFAVKGAKSDELECWISPCIGSQNFEVGEEVAEQFPDKFVIRQGYEKPHIDLKSYLVHGLLEMGMQRNHIAVSNLCTVSDNSRLFSHRAEDGKAGRMLAYAVIS